MVQLDHLKILDGDHYVVEINGKDRAAFTYTVDGFICANRWVTDFLESYPTVSWRIVNPNRSDPSCPDGLTIHESWAMKQSWREDL